MKTTCYFAILILAAWCVMTTTHELGHVLGGSISGGTLIDLELRPWRWPHSDFAPDPHPRVTLWSGPILGCGVPLLLASLIRRPWTWLIAHFCLLANGLYLALAWLSGDRLLDTPRLLAAGASPLSIATFCLLTIGWGYPAFRASVIAFFKASSG